MNGRLARFFSTLFLTALALTSTRLCAAVPPPNGPGSALGFVGLGAHLTAAPPALPTGNSPYTIEAWIKPTVMNAGTIAAWGNFGVNNQVNAFRLTPTGLVNYWWGNDLNVTVDLVGAWHHVAATFGGGTRSILVDGVVLGSGPALGHNAGSGNFQIGSANGGEFFGGQMDEVRIWNVARSATQIQEAMRRQLFGNESGLVAYWRFDEATGLNAFDATGNANNTATLVNSPAWILSTVVPFAPPMTTLAPSAITPTSATLNGIADGRTSVTTFEVYFEWGTTPALGNQLRGGATVSAGAQPQNYSLPLTGLVTGATYYFRAVAVTPNGASYGETFPLRASTTLTVRNNNDSGPESLRQVLLDARAGDTVVFAPNVTGTITLTSGELVVSQSLRVAGPGESVLTNDHSD
jgi:hypothetical protein